MTRVDFYVLQDQSPEQRIDMVCRLAEKAVNQSKRVFIHTDDHSLASSIDAALWHFREDAFVPHSLQTPVHSQQEDNKVSEQTQSLVAAIGDELQAPENCTADAVIIGCGGQPAVNQSVLINLSERVPPFFSRFERALEVVNQQDEIRNSGRSRYAFYQQRGYPLQHHKI